MNPNETKKTYFISIPKLLVETMIKQLRLKNPPNLEDIETVVHWCVAGSLSGEIFDDTMIAEGTSRKAMKRLEWELAHYVKELEEMKKQT